MASRAATVALAGAVYIYVGRGLCGFCDYSPSHRPRGVPRDAVWAGGPDGGSYILCRVDSAREVNPAWFGTILLVRWSSGATIGSSEKSAQLPLMNCVFAGLIEEGLEHNKVLSNMDLEHPRWEC
jgi:hypothetical protein